MKKLISFFVLVALQISLVNAEDTLIKEYSYDLMTYDASGVLSPSGIDIDGVNVAISAWADTAISVQTISGRTCIWIFCRNTSVETTEDLDTIESATAQLVDGYGYGIRNNLESPGDHQTIDNYSDKVNGTFVNSFEYLLFSFDSEVNVSQIDFGWNANNGEDQQVSVVSIEGAPEIEGESWGTIALNAISASFNITGGKNNGVADLSSLDNEYSNYWLVGAYNKAFGDIGGDENNDAFKISSIQFNTKQVNNTTPPAQVSEPGALALMSLGLGLVLYRRKRRA
ncbi:hypothetical protein BM528_12120 [Alteromonas sp. RW2A1]|jgi:hypothetical protein|uniref:exosortase-dependent surface protein XDP1 n=1 Tax=Alteromonas sp. RW2A1 TaxID=1917158 RepID=UPI0009035BA3|nr:exosortase-dependent surface protein XDP1 [Alteromonas sp. RW2A1]APE06422.1 hypothetical protein BM528_12120 [Alteromonas sp. RW2A1]